MASESAASNAARVRFLLGLRHAPLGERVLAGLIVATFFATLYIDPNLHHPPETKRRLFLAVLLLPALFGLGRIRGTWRTFRPGEMLVLLAPLVILAISGLAAGRLLPALDRAGYVACLFLLSLAVTALSLRSSVLLLGGVLAGALAVALLGIAERLGAAGLASTSSPEQPVSLFGNVAFSSEVVLPATWIALWFAGVMRRSRWAWCLLFHGLLVAYLSIAGTLAAKLVYVLVGAIATFIEWRRSVPAGRLAAAAFASGLVLFALPLGKDGQTPAGSEPGPAAEKPLDARTSRVRFLIYRSIVREVLPAHPILGLGAGSFVELYPPYRDPEEIALSARPDYPTVVDTAHSDPLEILAEGGVLGFLACLAALAVLLLPLRHALANPPMLWLFAALAGLLLNALVRSPLLDNPGSAVVFWILLGVLRGQVLQPAEPRTETPPEGSRFGTAILALIAAIGLWGTARGFAGVLADTASMKAKQQEESSRVVPLLRQSLFFYPSDHDTRRWLATRLHAESENEREGMREALREVRRALEDAPHSVGALELQGQYLAMLAGLADSREERIRLFEESLASYERAIALDPVLDRLRASALVIRAILAELRGDLRGAASWLEQYLEIETDPDKHAEKERELRALRRRIGGGPPQEPSSRETAFEAARRHFDAGRFTKMKEVFDAWIESSKDPAGAALEVGEELARWMLEVGTAAGEPFTFARNYSLNYKIRGHQARFLDSVASGDTEEARASWNRLAKYADYSDQPLARLDEAVLLFVEGNKASAVNRIEEFLAGEFQQPDPVRREIYGSLLKGTILERSWEAVEEKSR